MKFRTPRFGQWTKWTGEDLERMYAYSIEPKV